MATAAGILLVAIAGLSAFAYWRLQPQPLAAQVIYGSGRIEADEVRIAPEVSGRLVSNIAQEGSTIAAGAILARVDSTDYELQAARAEAQRIAAIRSTAQIDAQIALATHHAGTARTDLERYETLGRAGYVPAQRLDMVRNAYMAAQDQVIVLRQQRAQAEAQTLVAARTVDLARSQVGRTLIAAPTVGTVIERLVEPGEVVAAGQPIAVIANLQTVRLRVFVSESDLGRIRLGAVARIRVDAFPARYFPARVARIDARAQFTPRDVHMADERSRTVYGVTLEAVNPDGLLKPGMPADAWILWDSQAGWPQVLRIPA